MAAPLNLQRIDSTDSFGYGEADTFYDLPTLPSGLPMSNPQELKGIVDSVEDVLLQDLSRPAKAPPAQHTSTTDITATHASSAGLEQRSAKNACHTPHSKRLRMNPPGASKVERYANELPPAAASTPHQGTGNVHPHPGDMSVCSRSLPAGTPGQYTLDLPAIEVDPSGTLDPTLTIGGVRIDQAMLDAATFEPQATPFATLSMPDEALPSFNDKVGCSRAHVGSDEDDSLRSSNDAACSGNLTASCSADSVSFALAPLYLAVHAGDASNTALLLEWGADVNETTGPDGASALYLAAEQGHASIAKQLVDAGANVDAQRLSGASPLYIAAERGHEDVVSVLLEAGASHDARTVAAGAAPLHIAAQHGHARICGALLAAGAPPDAFTTKTGASALYLAAEHGHLDAARVLLAAGAQPDLCIPDGATPLLMAARQGHVAVAEALLEARADVNAAMGNGATALYIAIHEDRADVASLLLAHGAPVNPDPADALGCTPLGLAAAMGHAGIARLLATSGASVAHVPREHQRVVFAWLSETAMGRGSSRRSPGSASPSARRSPSASPSACRSPSASGALDARSEGDDSSSDAGDGSRSPSVEETPSPHAPRAEPSAPRAAAAGSPVVCGAKRKLVAADVALDGFDGSA